MKMNAIIKNDVSVLLSAPQRAEEVENWLIIMLRKSILPSESPCVSRSEDLCISVFWVALHIL